MVTVVIWLADIYIGVHLMRLSIIKCPDYWLVVIVNSTGRKGDIVVECETLAETREIKKRLLGQINAH